MATDTKRDQERASDCNLDPISGEPGAHPVGTGVGTAAGGVAAGAVGGAAAGPIGAAVGVVAGGIVGGLAGKSVAQSIDPTAEEAYWRGEYARRPYYDARTPYDQYAPAYRYGWESRIHHPDSRFDEAEHDLQRGWESAKDESRLTWDRARHATRDAWERIDRQAIRCRTDEA
jgi:hypothetical protein